MREEERLIAQESHSFKGKGGISAGFTLVELLVVISIVSVLMGILVPVLGKVRRQARIVVGVGNQRQIVSGLNCYTIDNDGSFPESVATIGHDDNWNWQAPTVLTSIESRAPHVHRAMSEYLRSYIRDATTMFCPGAPRRYKYLQQAWDAGDEWNNPDTWLLSDWVKGTYCFYWNYTGLLEEGLFKGPRNSIGGRGESRLLVSCYFGYDLYRSPDAYGSCEKFRGAGKVPEETASSAYWARVKSGSVDLNTIDVEIHAGYTDGHVDSYMPADVVTMKVIKDRSTLEPYDYGPGEFYLPRDAVR